VVITVGPRPDWAIDPEAVRWVGVENHVECTPECRESAVPCPYNRGRDALVVACPYCGSAPREHCTRITPGKGRRRVSWFHPSRLAAYQAVSAA
jgi:hypothetical protein